MTHTPEHWTVDYDETPWTSGDCRTAVEVGDDFGPVEILFSIRDGEGDVVCYCPWYPLAADQEQEELRSKARLIAAAPETMAERDRLKAINAELLATLQNIIPRFERCIIASGTSKELAMMATKAARAIIAKAQPEPSK